MIRQTDKRKDLDSIGQLVELGFSDKLKNEGFRVREEIRTYKRFYPFYWFASRVLGRFLKRYRFLLTGFVYEEQEIILGNVTVSRTGKGFERWMLSNLVTHPDHCRKGIARSLMLKAIRFAKEREGRICLLKVRSDNLPAVKLHESLGFKTYNQTITLKFQGMPKPYLNNELVDGYDLDTLKPGNSAKLYELLKEATPQSVQEVTPLNKNNYRSTFLSKTSLPFLVKVVEFFGRAKMHKYKIEKDANLIATLSLIIRLNNNSHRLFLVVCPQYQEVLADFLISKAFSLFSQDSDRNILISLNDCDEILINKCKSYGFKEIEREYNMFYHIKG